MFRNARIIRKGMLTLTFMITLMVVRAQYTTIQNEMLFNHASSIEKIGPCLLPNGDSLLHVRFVCSGFGGGSEGAGDNIVWVSLSDDTCKTFSICDTVSNEISIINSDSLARDPLIFNLLDTLVIIYRVQSRRGSGATGGQ